MLQSAKTMLQISINPMLGTYIVQQIATLLLDTLWTIDQNIVPKFHKKSKEVALMITFCSLWQYGLWSFQMGGTKLERFLPKNQQRQRKLLNFENWISGGLRSFQKSEF